jgi:hypothetical protein
MEMATNQTHSNADLTYQLLEKLRAMPAAAEGFFAYSVKIVCGKQTGANCCCVAGTRPGLYATEVNIQNLNFQPSLAVKFVQPLIHLGAVLVREPDVTDPCVYRKLKLGRSGGEVRQRMACGLMLPIR